MVSSNITVDNDEAGFKHNSNEVVIFRQQLWPLV